MKVETISSEKRNVFSPTENHRENGEYANLQYKAVSENLCCDLNGEAVILSMKSGKYYGLNQVGARIWELVQSPISAPAIQQAIMAEYNVAADVCQQEIKTFLSKMTGEGLIELVSLTAEVRSLPRPDYGKNKIY